MDKSPETLNAKSTTPEAFVPPRHWLGPEELEASYWNDATIREKRGQEFFEKPVELIDQIDRIDKKGLARRDFLTVMGASMAMASFACARRPVHKIIPYVVKPEEVTLGVANWYASTCNECSTGCGILVKDREARPIKLEGNPEHPMNQGTLCSRGQASLLNLYDPERLKGPVSRARTGNSQKDLNWNEVDSAIQSKLKEIATGAGRVRILTGEMNSPATQRVIQDFLSAFKNGSQVQFEPLNLSEISTSQGISYGTELIPQYRFDQADLIVSFSGDFLGNWVSPLEHGRAWGKLKRLEGQNPAQAKTVKLICFEPTLSLTGSNADVRYPVRPGDELKIALAIAHELIVKQGRSNLSRDTGVTSLLETYKSEAVAAEVGIAEGASVFKKIADELWASRGRSLVVAGSVQAKTRNALALQVAVNLLNSALENEGTTIDGTVNTSSPQPSYAHFSKLVEEMKAGQVDALIVYRSNPIFTAPKIGLEEAFKKVPLVIVVSDRVDETGLLADYVLPDHHYLENWGDASPRKGLYSLQQPTIAPIHSTRAFQESLLVWGKSGAVVLTGLATRSKDWHSYLQNHWKETLYKESGAAGTFEQFWEGVLRAGVCQVGGTKSANAKVNARSFRPSAVSQLPKYSPQTSAGPLLVLYSKVSMADGRSANNAWLQEMPDPISAICWDNYLNVGVGLAKKLGVKEDDVVEVKVGEMSVELPVHVQPGLNDHVVSVAVGYGRRSVGKVGNLAGVDVFPLVSVEANQPIFAGQPVTIKKTGRIYKLASTQWHTTTEDRPIINDISLTQFRKNPATAGHTDPHLRLETVPSIWPEHEYKGYRWGMAIDLSTCIGCGSCVIACQAENNIPVVGRDQVRVARQMHWIRIDRYYSGNPENPDLVFQPMLCQHCENAPCETVCPVLATVHDDEGLNVQVYNRCVGTRYCQNNCPYKVRRFNFFDHWKSYEGTMNLVWNPDVTVRTRGIMEKCTFCVQRIREAKDVAKDAGDKVRDGDIKTACQQTCPTNAIVFGDINDPKSRVSRLKESPQAFRVLEVLNTKPVISYMTKVRNKPEGAHAHEGNDHHA